MSENAKEAVECSNKYLSDCDNLYEDGTIYDADEVADDDDNRVVPAFAEAMIQAKEAIVDFYENRFEEAFKICSRYETGSLPHSHGQATLRFIFAMLTLEPPELEKAKHAIDMDIALCQNRKKQNSVTQSISNLIWRPVYDEYTDGDKETGVRELKAAVTVKDSVRYEYCAAVIMGYNLYMANIFGAGHGDLKFAQELCNETMAIHPKSILFKFFYARSLQVLGKPNEAIELYKECINLQCDWKPFHNICYWDLIWCYALIRNWEKAAEYAQLLSKQCKWSPATNMYQYAVFLHHMMEEQNREDLKEKMEEAIKMVPQLKIRYAGKTIPPEKFATEQALKYINNGEKFVLPAYELFYVWNIFATAASSNELLEPILAQIIEKEEEHKADKGVVCFWISFFTEVFILDNHDLKLDNYCKIYLLKGVCLKYLGRHPEALLCFKEIVDNESRVSPGSYIPPHASLELGFTHMKLKNFVEAKRWFERATNDYSGYLIEALVHLPLVSASYDEYTEQKGKPSRIAEVKEAFRDAAVVLKEGKKNLAIHAKQRLAHWLKKLSVKFDQLAAKVGSGGKGAYEPIPDLKPDIGKPDIGTDFKPGLNPEYKPDLKPDLKPEYKPDLKPEYKPDLKPEYKPDQVIETGYEEKMKKDLKPDFKEENYEEILDARKPKREANYEDVIKELSAKMQELSKGYAKAIEILNKKKQFSNGDKSIADQIEHIAEAAQRVDNILEFLKEVSVDPKRQQMDLKYLDKLYEVESKRILSVIGNEKSEQPEIDHPLEAKRKVDEEKGKEEKTEGNKSDKRLDVK
ncbi:tetratricopeptide repeat protein 39B-like protein [Dinothrombium tinctorium]|uniref:Tetratricopeptide repeat protein 39B-like protein n=1 Tax=Dinothrombium tinctorium TaxID=1965070 RepID=A0A3S3P2P9_9ACAR|nr:tetratricopeptide repeat protein 39B-like protein [Dinothrombium tinctorium]